MLARLTAIRAKETNSSTFPELLEALPFVNEIRHGKVRGRHPKHPVRKISLVRSGGQA